MTTTLNGRLAADARNNIESGLFKRIYDGALRKEKDFHYDVQSVRELHRFFADGRDSPIVEAKNISLITGRPVYVKLESHLQPGGSAKGRQAFNFILHHFSDYIRNHTQEEIAEISASQQPLVELFKRTYNDSYIASNSAGNFALALASVFGELSREFKVHIDFTGFLPKGAPKTKQYGILDRSPDTDGIVPLKFYDPKDPDPSKRDRNEVLRAFAEKKRAQGHKQVFVLPTEPMKGSAELEGLATLAAEIELWKNRNGVRNALSYFPSSSAPTPGAAVAYTGDISSVVFVQDARNGHLVTELLDKAERGEITIRPEWKVKLVTLKEKIIAGSAANGLSTPTINALTLEQILSPQKDLLLNPDNIKLVTPESLKLAAGLVYLETSLNKEVGAVLPEPAGSAAVAAALLDAKAAEEAKDQNNFATKVAQAIGTKENYDQFIKVSGLDAEELGKLGLGDLQNRINNISEEQVWASGLLRGHARTFSRQQPIIAIVSGANIQQPLEVALNEFIAAQQRIDPTELLEEFAKASPVVLAELLYRKSSRHIEGEAFHSGEEFAYALHSAVVLRHGTDHQQSAHPADRAAGAVVEAAHNLVLFANNEKPTINEGVAWIAEQQNKFRGFADKYQFEERGAPVSLAA